MKRVIFDIFLFIFVFVLPWWITLIWAITGLFIFKNYYEFLISSIIFYVISTTREYTFLNNSLIFYFGVIVFYLISQYIRRHIILYKNEISYKS